MAKKILIIEDDDVISKMYQISLKNSGYDVFEAPEGNSGLQSAQDNQPDLILLDIMMPGMDGFAVLEELKKNEHTSQIPVVMLTNLGQEEDRQRGEELGAIDYLVKADFTPMQVNEKITKYLK